MRFTLVVGLVLSGCTRHSTEREQLGALTVERHWVHSRTPGRSGIERWSFVGPRGRIDVDSANGPFSTEGVDGGYWAQLGGDVYFFDAARGEAVLPDNDCGQVSNVLGVGLRGIALGGNGTKHLTVLDEAGGTYCAVTWASGALALQKLNRGGVGPLMSLEPRADGGFAGVECGYVKSGEPYDCAVFIWDDAPARLVVRERRSEYAADLQADPPKFLPPLLR